MHFLPRVLGFMPRASLPAIGRSLRSFFLRGWRDTMMYWLHSRLGWEALAPSFCVL